MFGKNRKKDPNWMLLTILSGVLLLGFLVLIKTEPFYILFVAFILVAQLSFVFKWLRLVVFMIPIAEVAAFIYFAQKVRPHDPHYAEEWMLDLGFAFCLSCFVIVYCLVVIFIYKKRDPHKAVNGPAVGSRSLKKDLVLRELCDFCERRAYAVCQKKSDIPAIVLMGDSKTGELKLKYQKMDGTYKLISDIKGSGELKIFLDTYYYYSVGRLKHKNSVILNSMEKTYQSGWEEVLRKCEQRMKSSLEVKFIVLIE